jgi:hypothetical protein
VLSLGQQIRRHQRRVSAFIGQNQQLRGPGEHVDAHLTGHQLLARSVFGALREARVPPDAWNDPAPLPTPEALLAREPALRAQELRIRIVAEVTNQRLDVAREVLQELRAQAPDDPVLPRLEKWIAGDLPFDFGLLYDREAAAPPPVDR